MRIEESVNKEENVSSTTQEEFANLTVSLVPVLTTMNVIFVTQMVIAMNMKNQETVPVERNASSAIHYYSKGIIF